MGIIKHFQDESDDYDAAKSRKYRDDGPSQPENMFRSYISNCPFHACALNSGVGTCHSTNTIQCKSIPEQFKER